MPPSKPSPSDQRGARIALVESVVRAVCSPGGTEGIERAIAPHHTLFVPLAAFEPPRGLRGLRELSVLLRRTFSDFEITFHDAIVDGSRTAVRLSAACKHTGAVGPVTASGNRVEISAIYFARFSPDCDDLVESHIMTNTHRLLTQMGAGEIRKVGPVGQS
jgi:predicted ester cyclase